MSELEILFPEYPTIIVLGKPVTVKAVRLADLTAFGAASGRLLALMAACSTEQQAEFAEKHSGDLRRVLRMATSIGWWRARRLPAPVALELFGVVLQVNHRFFTQALAGAAKRLGGQLQHNG